MFKKILVLLGLCAMGEPMAQASSEVLPVDSPAVTDSLTLEKAWDLVLKHHPVLEAGRSALSAREAALDQAGRGPNPELGIEVEDVAGTGGFRGVDAAQTTVQLSQTLEWGGKRGGRMQTADAERKLAEGDWERKRLDLLATTHRLFLEALSAGMRLSLAREAKSLAEHLLEAVARRVKEGAASSADEIRSRLALSEADLEARQDSLRFVASKKKLALLWGGEKTRLPGLSGDLESLRPLPSLEVLARDIGRSPEAALRAGQVKVAEARLLQQKSQRRPDINVSAGIRHSAAPGDVALVAGVSLPLPVRNRNQGGREEARHEVGRIKAEEKAALLELESSLVEIHQTLSLARDEAETLREKLVPDADKAAQVLEEGYRRGRFGVLDVLNAKAELFRHRSRYLDALLRYQTGYAELERLIGAGEMPGKGK